MLLLCNVVTMPSLKHYEKNDPLFVHDLLESDKHVRGIADKLRCEGLTVEVQPLNIRPEISQMRQFSDNGDLLVNGLRVEVKQRQKVKFTGVHDYPYDDCMVDVCHTFDNAQQPIAAYIIESKPKKGIVCILPCSSKERWEKKDHIR
jgi:hypothetical protein